MAIEVVVSMALRRGLLTGLGVILVSAVTACSGSDGQVAAPGPIAVETGHNYNYMQESYLKAVRGLGWPAGSTEKDALFAALQVCGDIKDGLSDAPYLAHHVSETFGLDPSDSQTVVMTADVVFCSAPALNQGS